ncbi:SIL1 [Candida oxycetoniae]|uniref:Nucleotide exchange factor SIL1 n=1 Tax=Candida oxycetoniae TaxID=497107 RepID=A0AAI9SSM9_9ASCO|nr:SIL1 [Candida oxycetoniae]KAI3402338.2 SIL1 [Candida oxycetoniae]
MNLRFVSAIFASVLATTVKSSLLLEKELICPDPQNPSDCYPKIFEPTTEWQIIREGQEIPPGLHVRLNMDSLENEAKLISPENGENDNNSNDGETVELIVGEGGVVDNKEEDIQNRNEKIQKVLKSNKAGFDNKPKSRVHKSDLTNFDSALGEVQEYDVATADEQANKGLEEALDSIQEYVHDIELGFKLTQEWKVFQKLIKLAEHGISEEMSGKIYNIIASALRNNPQSVGNVINSKENGFSYVAFTKSLLNQLTSTTSDVIQKRILGIIQALTQSEQFVQSFFTFGTGDYGLNYLVTNFNNLGPQARQRVVNILHDLEIFGKSNDRRSLEDSDPNSNTSKFIQQALAEDKVKNASDFEKYFKTLVDLHISNSSLKPTKEFLSWLSQEVELRKEKKKRDDITPQELAFDDAMLRARHEVFGNPMGLRKAIADEL